MEVPVKGFFRLSPGREVRLRYGFFVTCREVIKDAAGEVVELRCTYDPATHGGNAPDGRKVKATLHWVAAADAVPAEIRLYNPLFTRPDPGADGDVMADLNPNSLEVLTGCLLEPALAAAPAGASVQFRQRAGTAGVQPHRGSARHVGQGFWGKCVWGESIRGQGLKRPITPPRPAPVCAGAPFAAAGRHKRPSPPR